MEPRELLQLAQINEGSLTPTPGVMRRIFRQRRGGGEWDRRWCMRRLPATLPLLGAKPVNPEIVELCSVCRMQGRFFACDETCDGWRHGARLAQPKGKRVVDRMRAALAPLLGTRLRAGDAAEITADDLSPR